MTEVEGIGRTYAIQNTTTHNDALRALQHDVDAIARTLFIIIQIIGKTKSWKNIHFLEQMRHIQHASM